MAYSAEDLDALRIFSDPTLDPLEKQRLLALPYEPPAPDLGPDQRVALNDGAGGTTGAPESLPDVPSGPIAAGSGGTTGATPPPVPQNSGAEGAAPAEPVARAAEAGASAPADVPVSLDEGDAPDVAGRGAGPARPQFDLPFATVAGGRAVPMERVTEQVSARQGVLSPGQRAAHSEALSEQEQATADLAALEAEQAQQQRDLEVQRRQAEMAERDRLALVRSEEMARAQEVEAQRQRVSQELLDVDVKDENLFAGQDFGDKLLTFVGLLALGAGLGATGNASQIIPTVQALARRETDKQKRFTELKQGQLSTLGTMYERHYQNLQNAELASKATQADILARYELELAKYGREMGPQIDQAALAQKLAALRTARVEAEAQRDKAFGDQVETQIQRAFARPMVQPALAAGAVPEQPAAPQKPRPQDFATEAEYFQALADYVEPQPAAKQPATAAARAGATPAAKGPTVTAGLTAEREAVEVPTGKLLDEGQYRQAIDRLPEKTRQGLEREAIRIKKELGDKATMADARVLATHRHLKWPVPKGYVFQHARDRAVRDAGGNMIYALGENPLEVKKQLTANNQLNSALALSLRAASKPAAKWSPEERAALETYANLTGPQIAVALGQGAMGDQESQRYMPPAGQDINGLADWIAGTGKAKVNAALQMFRDRRRVLLESFSKDPFDYVPVGAR